MLCCTSVLRSMVQGLGELLYAVLQICAVICAQICGHTASKGASGVYSGHQLGFGRAALCCAAHLCCICALSSGPRA